MPATAPYYPDDHYPTRVKDSRGNLQKCRSEVDQPRRGASRRSYATVGTDPVVEGWSCGSHDIHLEGNKEGADQRPPTAPCSPYNHSPTRAKDSRGNLQKCRSEVDQPRRGASRRS